MDEADEREPDYGSLVERELRIADNLAHCEKLWSEILSHYAELAARQKYIRVRRGR